MLKKLIAACITALSITVVASANNSFSMAPVHVVVSLSRPHTIVFIIKNTGDNLIHLRIKPEFLRLGAKGFNLGKSFLTTQKEDATSLKNNVIISPRALSLEPTEEREVRVSIRKPMNAKDGTYRVHIAARMMEIAYQAKSKANIQVGIHMNMLLQIATAVYANIGKPAPKITYAGCHTTKAGRLQLDFDNHTPWHMTIDVKAHHSDKSKKPIFKATGQIFRNSESYVLTGWKPKDHQKILITWVNAKNAKQVGHAECKV